MKTSYEDMAVLHEWISAIKQELVQMMQCINTLILAVTHANNNAKNAKKIATEAVQIAGERNEIQEDSSTLSEENLIC